MAASMTPYRDAPLVLPGRKLSAGVRARVLFGHRFSVLAWLFALLATLTFWNVYKNSPIGKPGLGAGPRGIVNGRVTEVYVAAWGSCHIQYDYVLPDGRVLSGEAFGAPLMSQVSDVWEVEVDLAHPERSLPVGLQPHAYPSELIALPLALALIALWFGLRAVIAARWRLALLRYGRLAEGPPARVHHLSDDKVALTLAELPGKPAIEGERVVTRASALNVYLALGTFVAVSILAMAAPGMALVNWLYSNRAW